MTIADSLRALIAHIDRVGGYMTADVQGELLRAKRLLAEYDAGAAVGDDESFAEWSARMEGWSL